MKICTRCGKKKPLSEFHKHKRSRDGLRSRCKSCIKEEDAAYRKSNPEKVIESRKRWKQANQDKIKESDKRYRAENKEQVAERKRRYKQANPEKVKESRKRYYNENKEQVAERKRRWRQANPEKVREMAHRYPHKQKARKKVQTALRNGSMTRPNVCSACNSKTLIEAHHEDYSKPLDVTWLCKKCHVEADAEITNA